MANSVAVFVSFLVLVSASYSLRMVMLDVPTAANQGESVELSCIYELENEVLYSIKWYKNDVEFYRYVPNDWPPGQFLPLPGVRVELSKSGKRSVYLRNVDLNSTGTYRCEVSAEAPSFKSVEAEGNLKVMVLPTEGPSISGGEPKYNVGDEIAINCTSAKSKPAATLKWFVNDILVEPGDYEIEYSMTLHEDGLETSSLSLRFVAKDKHFVDGAMRLKCTASISRIYTMSNEEMFLGGRQQSSTLQVPEDESREIEPRSGVENSGLPSKSEELLKHSLSATLQEVNWGNEMSEESSGESTEKPVKGASTTKLKGQKQMQSVTSGSITAFCNVFLAFFVVLLHLRVT